MKMKLFTRKSLYFEEEEDWNNICSQYFKHLERIFPHLTAPIKRLSKINLHDGLICRVDVDHMKQELHLQLRCGDLQIGYFDLHLNYLGIDLRPAEISILKRRCKDYKTEVLYDEIDTDSKRYYHRLLFYPKDELSISFSALILHRHSRQNRDYEKITHKKDKYSEFGTSQPQRNTRSTRLRDDRG